MSPSPAAQVCSFAGTHSCSHGRVLCGFVTLLHQGVISPWMIRETTNDRITVSSHPIACHLRKDAVGVPVSWLCRLLSTWHCSPPESWLLQLRVGISTQADLVLQEISWVQVFLNRTAGLMTRTVNRDSPVLAIGAVRLYLVHTFSFSASV